MIIIRLKAWLLVAILCLAAAAPTIAAENPPLLKARVFDIEGRCMEGAKLFIYDSSNVRRPAQFITSLSDRAGLIQIAVPSGKYWVVARYKADGKYGPLMPGDKHSGEPFEVDMTGGSAEADFVVADIRELGQKKRAGATEALRLKGRVLDTEGVAVTQALVYANRTQESSDLPDYVSAWTGDDGRYEIYLPPESVYYLGVSRQFPPVFSQAPPPPRVIELGKIDIAIDIDLTVQ